MFHGCYNKIDLIDWLISKYVTFHNFECNLQRSYKCIRVQIAVGVNVQLLSKTKLRVVGSNSTDRGSLRVKSSFLIKMCYNLVMWFWSGFFLRQSEAVAVAVETCIGHNKKILTEKAHFLLTAESTEVYTETWGQTVYNIYLLWSRVNRFFHHLLFAAIAAACYMKKTTIKTEECTPRRRKIPRRAPFTWPQTRCAIAQWANMDPKRHLIHAVDCGSPKSSDSVEKPSRNWILTVSFTAIFNFSWNKKNCWSQRRHIVGAKFAL